jgi:very-short-patch-repair endonuclease
MNRAAERAVSRIASRQHGLFTRQDAHQAGLSNARLRRAVARGAYRALSRDVFAAGGSPSTWRQAVLAVVLAGGPGCVASHRTAAALHRFDGFAERRGGDRPPIEVTVARRRNRFRTAAIVHLTQDLGAEDRTVVDAIPCTSVARTLLDLGQVETPACVEEALDGAERDGRARRADVERTLARTRRRGRPGVATLDQVAGPGRRPTTGLERRFLRIIDRAGLPRPVPQFAVKRPDGSEARIDFAYVEERVAIELDGHDSHATRARRSSDARRGNDISNDGWHPLTFTRAEVDDGWRVVRDVTDALTPRRAG